MAEKKVWKTIAIIFIILFVLETAFLIWLFSAGTKDINRESECIVNICGDEKYDSYYYDYYTQICECYIDGELDYQEFMG